MQVMQIMQGKNLHYNESCSALHCEQRFNKNTHKY